ncbi:hypothetical protein J1N35_024415 [Gossypium stocksii]|uniref:Uncharacterized protein n=1 Tax=Gossypium stocksii TaxID=47602 RepID=A0A9D3V4A6_9ROSI|nr:hypothetical protein J1N35_024415 [Gossypium stocksii]
MLNINHEQRNLEIRTHTPWQRHVVPLSSNRAMQREHGFRKNQQKQSLSLCRQPSESGATNVRSSPMNLNTPFTMSLGWKEASKYRLDVKCGISITTVYRVVNRKETNGFNGGGYGKVIH